MNPIATQPVPTSLRRSLARARDCAEYLAMKGHADLDWLLGELFYNIPNLKFTTTRQVKLRHHVSTAPRDLPEGVLHGGHAWIE